MIQVIYYRNHNRVTIKGHAKSAEYGRDLICAGVSTLALTLAANVQGLMEGGQVKDGSVKLEPGDTEISCCPSPRHRNTVTLIFDAVCAGFEVLASKFPEYVALEIHQG